MSSFVGKWQSLAHASSTCHCHIAIICHPPQPIHLACLSWQGSSAQTKHVIPTSLSTCFMGIQVTLHSLCITVEPVQSTVAASPHPRRRQEWPARVDPPCTHSVPPCRVPPPPIALLASISAVLPARLCYMSSSTSDKQVERQSCNSLLQMTGAGSAYES